MIDRAALDAALEATWPAAGVRDVGRLRLRDDQGGGQRVSAATVAAGWNAGDLDHAEAAMRAAGQTPILRVDGADTALDAALAARGWRISDPSLIYAVAIADLEPAPPPMTGFAHWPPLAIVQRIWAEAGIGPARLAVMGRAAVPRTALLGRTGDRPSAAAFVAVAGSVGMLHALEVAPDLRRRGAGAALVRHAGAWAGAQGALHLALAVTAANAPACALYEGLGMTLAGRYHYRVGT